VKMERIPSFSLRSKELHSPVRVEVPDRDGRELKEVFRVGRPPLRRCPEGNLTGAARQPETRFHKIASYAAAGRASEGAK